MTIRTIRIAICSILMTLAASGCTRQYRTPIDKNTHDIALFRDRQSVMQAIDSLRRHEPFSMPEYENLIKAILFEEREHADSEVALVVLSALDIDYRMFLEAAYKLYVNAVPGERAAIEPLLLLDGISPEIVATYTLDCRRKGLAEPSLLIATRLFGNPVGIAKALADSSPAELEHNDAVRLETLAPLSIGGTPSELQAKAIVELSQSRCWWLRACAGRLAQRDPVRFRAIVASLADDECGTVRMMLR